MSKRLALRYAKALINAIKSQPSELDILSELGEMQRVFSDNSDLSRLLRSIGRHPVKSKHIAGDLIERFKPSPLIVNFVKTLIENRRVYLLTDILDTFTHEMKRRQHIIEASIVSIRPLESAEKKMITDCLESSSGRPVEIKWRIDRSILGGICVRIGDELFDGSLLSRMNQLHDELMKG